MRTEAPSRGRRRIARCHRTAGPICRRARSNDPDDFVVLENKAALEQNKRMIPVLVGGATMPPANALPEPIRPLARRDAVELRPERFQVDSQGLITALREQFAAAARERAAQIYAKPPLAEEIGEMEEIANTMRS
jgi:hypothetical protein